MEKDDEVRERIIAKFVEDLNLHLLSKSSYPKEVTIRIAYEECVQTLTIEFN